MHTLLTQRARDSLQAAGWHEGQIRSLAPVEVRMPAYGFPLHAAAREFLTKYLGVELSIFVPRYALTRIVRIDPLHAVDRFSHLLDEPELRKDLHVLARSTVFVVGCTDVSLLLMAENGAVYGIDEDKTSWFQVGRCPEEALNNLCNSGAEYEFKTIKFRPNDGVIFLDPP